MLLAGLERNEIVGVGVIERGSMWVGSRLVGSLDAFGDEFAAGKRVEGGEA